MISIRDWQWQFPLPYNIHFSSNCQWHCTTVSQVLSIWTVGFCEFSCSFSFKCLLLVHFSFETDDALNTHVLALWNEVKSCNHVIVVYLVSLWHYFPSPPLSLSPIAVQMRWLQPKMITHTQTALKAKKSFNWKPQFHLKIWEDCHYSSQFCGFHIAIWQARPMHV